MPALLDADGDEGAALLIIRWAQASEYMDDAKHVRLRMCLAAFQRGEVERVVVVFRLPQPPAFYARRNSTKSASAL